MSVVEKLNSRMQYQFFLFYSTLQIGRCDTYLFIVVEMVVRIEPTYTQTYSHTHTHSSFYCCCMHVYAIFLECRSRQITRKKYLLFSFFSKKEENRCQRHFSSLVRYVGRRRTGEGGRYVIYVFVWFVACAFQLKIHIIVLRGTHKNIFIPYIYFENTWRLQQRRRQQRQHQRWGHI